MHECLVLSMSIITLLHVVQFLIQLHQLILGDRDLLLDFNDLVSNFVTFFGSYVEQFSRLLNIFFIDLCLQEKRINLLLLVDALN